MLWRVVGAWREREHASGRATYPGPHRCLIKTCRRRVITMGSSGTAIHIQSYSCDANTGAKNVGRCPLWFIASAAGSRPMR